MGGEWTLHPVPERDWYWIKLHGEFMGIVSAKSLLLRDRFLSHLEGAPIVRDGYAPTMVVK